MSEGNIVFRGIVALNRAIDQDVACSAIQPNKLRTPRALEFPESYVRTSSFLANHYTPLSLHQHRATSSSSCASSLTLFDPSSTHDQPVDTSSSSSGPYLISQGILSNRTITEDHPEVHLYLEEARSRVTALDMSLPPCEFEEVFALAAFACWTKALDPAHWMFWGDHNVRETCTRFSRILEVSGIIPSYVICPMDKTKNHHEWYRMQMMHSSSVKEQVRSQMAWFDAVSPAECRLRTRKRKLLQAETVDAPPSQKRLRSDDPRIVLPLKPKPSSSTPVARRSSIPDSPLPVSSQTVHSLRAVHGTRPLPQMKKPKPAQCEVEGRERLPKLVSPQLSGSTVQEAPSPSPSTSTAVAMAETHLKRGRESCEVDDDGGIEADDIKPSKEVQEEAVSLRRSSRIARPIAGKQEPSRTPSRKAKLGTASPDGGVESAVRRKRGRPRRNPNS